MVRTIFFAGALLAGCAAPASPVRWSVSSAGELEAVVAETAVAPAASPLPPVGPTELTLRRAWIGQTLRRDGRLPAAGVVVPRVETQRSAAAGSGVRLPGTGLGFDFGSGQAPYDDGPHDNALMPDDDGGFSDALLQMTFHHGLGPGTGLVGAVGAARTQDVPLWDAIGEAEVTWVTVGFSVRF